MLARERDLLVLHGGTAAVGAIVLAAAPPGVAALVVVATYSAALYGLAVARRDPELWQLWWFAATLSVWQVLPDVVLVELGTLRFPDPGVPTIGAVPIHMAGMWAVPTVVVLSVGDAVARRRGDPAGWLAVGAVALATYVAAELAIPRLGIWEAVGVTTLDTVALYVITAQTAMSILSWAAWRQVRRSSAGVVAVVALVISSAYTGVAATAWALIDG